MSDENDPTVEDGEPLAPAGTEAPAWVADLLGTLRTDDPPVPDDVARRLDGALAALTPADVLPAEGTAPRGAADTETSPSATVVPLAARDRRQDARSPWGHRLLLGGVAASAALVLGGLGTVAVVRNSGGTSAEPGLSADAGAGTSGGDRVRYVASNQDYTAETLDTTTQAVLAASTSPLEGATAPAGPSLAPSIGDQPSSDSPTAPTTGSSQPPSGSASTPVTSPAARLVVLHAASDHPSESCVDSLAGSPDVDPLLVDEATYEKRPAFVVVIATADDAASADVWVVARTCTAGNEGVLAFARIAR